MHDIQKLSHLKKYYSEEFAIYFSFLTKKHTEIITWILAVDFINREKSIVGFSIWNNLLFIHYKDGSIRYEYDYLRTL